MPLRTGVVSLVPRLFLFTAFLIAAELPLRVIAFLLFTDERREILEFLFVEYLLLKLLYLREVLLA